jgi:hypothetical protein
VRNLPIRPGARKRENLLPATTVTRDWPANVVASDASLFYHELVRRFPPVRIRTVRAAKIVPGLGPCYWSGAIKEAHIRESPSLLGRVRRAVAWWSSSAKRSEYDELFWITDAVSTNYFHWFTDALPRLHLICTLFKNCNILLPKEYENFGFVTESLRSFPEANFLYVADGKPISVPCLKILSAVAPQGNFNPDIVGELRFRLLHYLGAHTIGDEGSTRPETGIYVSRAKTNKRRISNEVYVVSMIEKLGYQTVTMEDLSLTSQINLMKNTKVLLGPHGAGLTNMIFMPTGSVIVEIRKEGDSHNNCFFSLACALGHKYYYLLTSCSPIGLKKSEYFAEDFVVDVSDLSTLLQQVATDSI